MSYTVTLSPLDFTPPPGQPGASQAGIWTPPPPAGSTPANPTATATITPTPTLGVLPLAFPTLPGPPASGTLWVSDTKGDLFRSGAIGQFPPSGATLTVFVLPGQQNGEFALTQADLDEMVTLFPLGTTIPVDDKVQWAFRFATGGLVVPTSITPMTASLTLPAARPAPGSAGTLNLQVTGTIVFQRVFFFNATKSFTFAMTLGLPPSADPVNTYRIVAATVVSPDPSLGIPGSGFPGKALSIVADFLAGNLAAMIESQANSAIFPMVRNQLAAGDPPTLPPQMMTQTATVSMADVTIAPAGITIAAAIGDLFGPAIVPIPPPPPPTTVPNVVGDDVPTAQQTLTDANLFMYWKDEVPSPTVLVPTVVAQTPAAEASVPEGTWVTCKVVRPPIEHN